MRLLSLIGALGLVLIVGETGSAEAKLPIRTKWAPAKRAGGMAKAAYLGKVRMPKPSRAFYDPRKGGEWWRCPRSRPRRTAYAVTSKRACATKRIIGERLSRAKFLGKVKRPKPRGAFVDPRRGGEYWRCPARYQRTVYPVTSARACQSKGCPKGAFMNHPFGGCYTCPRGYRRSMVVGVDLAKVKRACVKVSLSKRWINKQKRRNFARLKRKVKRITKKWAPHIDALVRVAKARAKYLPSIIKAKSAKARRKRMHRIAAGIVPWAKKRNRQASYHMPKRLQRAEVDEWSEPVFQPASARQLMAIPRPHAAPSGSKSKAKNRRVAKTALNCQPNSDDFCTFTFGYVFDASFIGGGNITQFWAWDITPNAAGKPTANFYTNKAWTVGISAGFDMALEFGFYSDLNNKLAGTNHGVVFGASFKAGAAVGVFFNDAGETLGFTITVPQGGFSGEAEYARGETTWSGSY